MREQRLYPYCTHHMPAKKKLLPRPCPICGDKFGTYQFILFNSRYKFSRQYLTCRIRHYSPEVHAEVTRRKKERKVTLTVYEKRWHSFQVLWSSDDFPWDEYFERYGFIEELTKSVTFKPTDRWYEIISKYGWQPVSLPPQRNPSRIYLDDYDYDDVDILNG
jgi:hypothetical protein